MPAPKRGSSPHDSQPKMRKLDEDGEDLPSKTAPATHNRSLITGNTIENTAAPRTKKKLCASAEGGNKPAKSSPLKDSSKTISDPPLKKAKLLKATSASCGEAPSQKANSKASLKRTASTESEDDLNSDSSKTDLFRERDDGDKARCFRQYSNRVKAKRKVEESTSDPKETSQGSPAEPGDPVQMEHNYGRFSDESTEEERKESVTEGERQEMSVNATQAESTEALVPVRGSSKASIEFQCAADEAKHEEFKNVEKLIVNDALAPCSEVLAAGSPCITSEAGGDEKRDFAIKTQKDVVIETLTTPVETLFSNTGEANPGCEGEVKADEMTDCRSQTDVNSETATKENTESASEEVKCKSKEEKQEVIEAASVSAHHTDVEVSNETSSAPEEILVKGSNPESQTDLSVKIQVTFKEESKAEARVRHEVPDTINNSCDGVNKLVRKSEESDRRGVEFLLSQPVAGSGSFAELQLSREVMDKTTDGCTEIQTPDCEAVTEQNQSEALSGCVTVSEGQADVDMETKITPEERFDSALKEDKQNKGRAKDHTTEIPEVKGDANTSKEKEVVFGCATATPEQEISNQVATVEIQTEKKSQKVSECATDKSKEFNKDHVLNSKVMDNEDKQFGCTSIGLERQITTASVVSNPASTVLVHNQERSRDSERTMDMSDKAQKCPVSNCQGDKDESRADYENQKEVTTSEEISSIARTVEIQSQEVSEPTMDISAEFYEDHKVGNMENENKVKFKSLTALESQIEMQTTSTLEVSNPAASVEIQKRQIAVDVQNTTTSVKISNTTPTVEIQSQNEVNVEISNNMEIQSQEVSERTMVISAELHEEKNKVNFESVSVPESQIEMEMQTTSTSEVSTPAASVKMQERQTEVDMDTTTALKEMSHTVSAVEIQAQRSQEVSEPTTDVCTELHEEENKVIFEPVSMPEGQMKMEMQTKLTEISNIAHPVEIQCQTGQNEVNVHISNMAPTVEISAQKVSEHTTDISAEVHVEENKVKSLTALKMKMQTTLASEVTNPAVSVEIQKSGTEVDTQTTTASEEICIIAPTVELQRPNEVTASVEIPNVVLTVETQAMRSQDVTEPATDISEKAQEGLRIQTTESDGKRSDPVETQNQRGEEVSELTTEVLKDFIATNTASKEYKEKVKCVDATGDQIEMDVQTTATAEDISNPPPAVEIQSQRSEDVTELNTKVQFYRKENEDKITADCVPEVHINMETTTEIFNAAEQQMMEDADEPTMALSNEIPKPLLVSESKDNANLPGVDNIQGDLDVISGSIGREDSALEEETGRQVINNEVKEEVAVISSDKAVSNVEAHKEETRSNELIVFVCGQPNDIAVQASEEQVKTAEVYENQIVYEPISSPESNDGREFPSVSENHKGVSLLDLQGTYEMEGDSSTNVENSCQQLENQQICASDSREVEMEVPMSCVPSQSEQSVMNLDVKQVAEISSSDDVSVPDGQSEDAPGNGESNGYPDGISATEFPEQEEEVADVTVTTTTASTEMPDSTSEEFVILEPVPEVEIDFDIVTQAVTESGLSVSLSEQMNPDENGSQETGFPEAEGSQCQTTEETKVTDSSEVLDHGTRLGTEISTEEGVAVVQNRDHMMYVDTLETDMANSHANEECSAPVIENAEANLDLQEVQILEDIEIGREIVVAEEDNDEDSDITTIEKPQETPEAAPPTSKKSEKTVKEKAKDDSLKQNSTTEKTEDDKKGKEAEKPKKQEMNTQAKTKARLAALAEQKAAAAKRTANRQQLNLLALCQEIAEDIATDSMLLKRIEEEKQAAAAVAAAAAAKIEASKKETPPVNKQEADAVSVATPAGPEGSSASVAPAEEAPSAQPSTEDSADTKPATEAPKRRFFVTQISVPLKAHEKKKLTRYQRLRQVELQREKMSWARVKKFKSDQVNQMFSDLDWEASSFSVSPVTTAPLPAASPSKTPLPSPPSTSTPAPPKADVPKVDTPKAEPSKTETETSTIEPTKSEPEKEKDASKTGTPNVGTRKSTRQSKAVIPKEAPAPGPAPKVTRSAGKRTLPAVPPPMPNGLKAPKPKPIEYKPYRPRPKYSFDDFELDDDPLPAAPTKPSPQARPTQPARPNVQSNPAATQSKLTLQSKPTVSSHPAIQAKLKAQTRPAGQISGHSKPSVAATAQSKPSTSTTPQLKPTAATTPQSKATAAATAPSVKGQLKTPVLTTPQSKAVSAPAQSKPTSAAAAAAPLKPAGGGGSAQLQQPAASQAAGSTTSETKPAVPRADSAPQKTPSPPSSEDKKCKDTADPTSTPPSEDTSKVSDNTHKCEEKPAVTDPPLQNKTKSVEATKKAAEEPQERAAEPQDGRTPLSDACLQKDVKKLKEADKDGTQTIIDAGQKHFGAVACSVCGMLYSAANPEDESQHLLFHNQFISAVKYVGWKKERILAEYPDGKIILVLPDDPKYALKKVEEIREMVDNDLGFQQVETKFPSQTKTFLFISNDKKVGGCLIAEHIQEGYRVIEEPEPEGSEGEKVMFERQRAWCCSTTAEPAICGISRIWVVNMMRRQGIASRMLECLRNNFIYGSYLSKDEIAFSDPTPDGKLFATRYFGTSQFLVYNFVSGTRSSAPNTEAV